MWVISVIFVILAISKGTTAIVDYCAVNKFNSNDSWLQLTKEASSCEYAIEHNFKGLHCCAKGYRSIEWYKDGRPYPWPESLSNFILYPESANQTIYTPTVSASDSGNYTCALRNDTHIQSHTIYLQVFEKVPDAPKVTFFPASYQEISLGSTVRLFCEAFLGQIDLPDAHNEVYWKRADQNGSLENSENLKQDIVTREDGNTVGVYLSINHINMDDYGQYICRISKPDIHVDMSVRLEQKVFEEYISINPVPWKKITIAVIVITLIIMTVVMLNLQYGMLVRVYLKDRLGSLETNDGKLTDALICYSQKDSELVLGILLPKLESKYKYTCATKEFSSDINNWHIEMHDAACKSRRVISVISPACFNDKWDINSIYRAIKQLKTLGPPLKCITLKPFPSTKGQLKNDQGETLRTLLQTITVLNWDRSVDDQNFWLSVRLHLPPRRYHISALPNDNTMVEVQAHSTRLNSNSHESLEVLV